MPESGGFRFRRNDGGGELRPVGTTPCGCPFQEPRTGTEACPYSSLHRDLQVPVGVRHICLTACPPCPRKTKNGRTRGSAPTVNFRSNGKGFSTSPSLGSGLTTSKNQKSTLSASSVSGKGPSLISMAFVPASRNSMRCPSYMRIRSPGARSTSAAWSPSLA